VCPPCNTLGCPRSHNSFEGPLPSKLPPALTELDLSRNEFTGPLPEAWPGPAAALVTVDLRWKPREGGHACTGPRPPRLLAGAAGASWRQHRPCRRCGGSPSLSPPLPRPARRSNNRLQGRIPIGWADAPALKAVRLSNNAQVSGCIPDELEEQLAAEMKEGCPGTRLSCRHCWVPTAVTKAVARGAARAHEWERQAVAAALAAAQPLFGAPAEPGTDAGGFSFDNDDFTFADEQPQKQPAATPAAQPAAKPAAKPVMLAVAKPAAQGAAKPAPKPAAKPAKDEFAFDDLDKLFNS
jgi:hypothetical protein